MTISHYIKEALRESLKGIFEGVQGDLSKRINRTMIRFENKIARKILSFFILSFALLFLAASAVFLLIEYIGLNKTESFAIAGVLLLLIGVIANISS